MRECVALLLICVSLLSKSGVVRGGSSEEGKGKKERRECRREGKRDGRVEGNIYGRIQINGGEGNGR